MPTCPECLQSNPELGAKCPRCEESYYVDDAAAKSTERDPYIGRMAAEKFVVVSRISEGGMGTVYQALQLPVDRKVAFKVLRADLEDNEDIRRRFIREARAVAKIAHPNIIHLHDFGFDDSGYPYMVMEYAPGTNLDTWIYRDDITVERGLHVTRQILSALADAHAAGIVHRDLKPENIIVRGTGTDRDFIKLLDFGIARMVNEQATSGLTREGEVFGTPHYMSPEQAEGETGIGPAADVYAVGIILYEMLCGEHPFDAPKPLSILFKQINEPLPRIEPRPGFDVPDWVVDVVQKATQKDPSHRFENAGAMLEAFEDPRTTATQSAPRGGVDRVDPADDGGPSEPSDADPSPRAVADSSPRTEEAPPAASHVEVEDPNPTVNPSIDEGTAAATSGLGWGRRHLIATVIGAGVVLLLGGGALFVLAPGSSDDPQAKIAPDAGPESLQAMGENSEEEPVTEDPDVGESRQRATGVDVGDDTSADPARAEPSQNEPPAAEEKRRAAQPALQEAASDEQTDEGSRDGTSVSSGGTPPGARGSRAGDSQEESAETTTQSEDPPPAQNQEPKAFQPPTSTEDTSSETEAPKPTEEAPALDEPAESDEAIQKFGDPSSIEGSPEDSDTSDDTDDGVKKFGPPGE